MLYHYDLHRDWPKPSYNAIYKAEKKKTISIIILVLLIIFTLAFGSFESILKNIFVISLGIYCGISNLNKDDYLNRLYPPRPKHRKNEYVKITPNKITWKLGQGLFDSENKINMKDILAYTRNGNTVYLKTKYRTYALDVNKIVNHSKRKELGQLLNELSKRDK